MFSLSVTLQGSLSNVILPDDLSKILIENKLYKINTDVEVEMDIPSVFYSLKFLKKLQPDENDWEKKLFNCAYHPISNGGFFVHNHWKSNEVHLRFTSAVLLFLVNEVQYDINNPICIYIEKALETHFSYGEHLEIGYWFLHDSHEKNGDYYPDYTGVKSVLWGKSLNNYLILNTHIDTLILLESAKIKGYNINYSKYSKGYQSLDFILKIKPCLYHFFDSKIRNLLIRQKVKKPTGLLHSLLLKYYARIRFKFKHKKPLFFYNDGFSEREVGLTGESLGYHVVNLWDLSRLMILLKNNNLTDKLDIENAKIRLSKGFDYLLKNKNYFNFNLKYFETNCSKICEAIIFSILLDKEFYRFMPLYLKSRKHFDITPLFLNTDVLNPNELSTNEAKIMYHFFIINKCDFIKLNKNKVLVINYGNLSVRLNKELVFQYNCNYLLKNNTEIEINSNSYHIINIS